jgi:hypothetical protein
MRHNSLFWITQVFMDAESDAGGGDLTVDDIIGELGKDDGEEIPETEGEDLLADSGKKEDKKDDKEEPEEKEDKELELEPEELDNIEEVPRKEILKKYPDIFKDFPQLEKSFYREKRYAEMFPTIEDGKEALEKAENYDKFSETVLSGDITDILASVKSADAKAYNKMVDGYLGTLQKVDQTAYFHVIGNVIKQTIAGMVRDGKASENENLQMAGVILNQYIFGKNEYEAPATFGPHKSDDKEDELTKEKQEFFQAKFDSALEDLTTRSENVIKSTISKHIDPKDSMTGYVKSVAIEKALKEVDSLISQDARFKSVLDKLWQKAAEKNFSKTSLEDIQRAHLNKAKTLLPDIIRKHRSEALRGLGKRVNDEKEEPVKRGPVSVGRSALANNRSKETEVPKGIKTIDFLNMD